jgi:tetratricopeptide (TPR) repeat protein
MLNRMLRVLVLAVLAVPAAAFPQAAPAPDATRQAGGRAARAPEALLAEVDAAYKERDAPGVMEKMQAKLEDAEKRWPDDYEVLWRLARHYFWLSDAPELDRKDKSRQGKIAWQYGDRATVANPDRVEGWNYAAAGMGNYALGIGIISALRQGIEGKFKERLQRAGQIDHAFQNGAIHTAWGRFWYELPWPKYSVRKSRRSLQEALRLNPDNVRAHVYMAELNLKEGDADRARSDLEKAVANPPRRYDPPEERRWQAVARRLLAEM